MKYRLLVSLLFLHTLLWSAEEVLQATRNYLAQTRAVLPVKSVMIHPQNRTRLLGKAIYGRPALPYSYISTQGHFKIHYTLTGDDAVNPISTNPDGVPDYVYQAGQIAERCYSLLLDTLRLDAPPVDNYDGPQIDFYIKNWNGATYAETYPENEVTATSRPYDYTAYTIIDNDYQEFASRGLAGLQVTIAHELFHIVQLGYNWWPTNGLAVSNGDAYFLEWNSTWFEEYAYPEVNDYFYYLNSFFTNPVMPLWSDSYSYALGPFFRMIVEQADSLFIKRVWERIKSDYALTALEKEVSNTLSSELSELWHIFMRRCFFTSTRYDSRYALSADAASFPLLTIPVANRGDFIAPLIFQTPIQSYAHQPFLIATPDPVWLAMRAEVTNASPVMGSYVLSKRYGTAQQTLVWKRDNLLGKFESGDLLFVVITNGSKNQSGDVTLALEEAPDSATFTTSLAALFPNPLNLKVCQDLHVFLQTDRSISRVTVKLYNILGEQVFKWQAAEPLDGAGLHELCIPGDLIARRSLASGIYILALDCGYKTVYGRFVGLK